MLRKADSRLVVFMSCIFKAAMSCTCFFVTLPTLTLLGIFDPDPGFY
jgi:hypothetical protein